LIRSDFMFNLKFGDGIMSMIDCKVTLDKKEDPKGDRAVLTFEYAAYQIKTNTN
jgi:cyanate lyase